MTSFCGRLFVLFFVCLYVFAILTKSILFVLRFAFIAALEYFVYLITVSLVVTSSAVDDLCPE